MDDLFTCTCPCCGGSLKFEASLQKIKCEYCDTEYEVSDLKELNDPSNKIEENTNWESNTEEFTSEDAFNVYSCNTCGGEVMCDENTTSTICPYCGNPVLFKERLSGGLKPKFVIPFKLEKDAAKENLGNYFKGKILLPNDFKKLNEVKEITSLYVPYWIFDADVNGLVTYSGTKVRTWSDSNYRYKETKYYRIVRKGDVSFEHLPVDASKKMDDKMMESIEPFDFKGAKEYSNAYIVGYAADKYDVSKEETFKRANQRIKEGTIDIFTTTVHGYDTLNVDDATISYNSNQASYALYPVWTLNTQYKEKNFQFAMNAQTGKIVGNLPISIIKATLWFIFSFLIIGGIVFGILFAITSGSEYRIMLSILFGLIIGLASAFGINAALRRQMKPVRFQHGASNYVLRDTLKISNAKDIYLYKKVSKTKIERSNK